MTGEKLFDRKCRLHVYDSNSVKTTIEGLRVTFEVKHTHTKTPNTCEIKIYNLSESSRGLFKKKAQRIELEIGYRAINGIVFSGDIRTVDHERTGSDLITIIKAGDGERLWKHARFPQESFPKGTTVDNVINRAYALLSPYGLLRGNLDDALSTFPRNASVRSYARGYSPSGLVVSELESIFKTLGWVWSVQHGALNLTYEGKHFVGTSLVVLNHDSGLLFAKPHGSSDNKKGTPKTEIDALINPQFRPGRAVRVTSTGVNGDFKIKAVTHSGDTHGSNWTSKLEVVSL